MGDQVSPFLPGLSFDWLGSPAQSAQQVAQPALLGSGIPFAQQYGGYGAYPAQAQQAFDAANMSQWSQMPMAEKLGVVGQGLGAFSTLAQIYSGFKALKLQKDMFKFAKDSWNKNYNNQLKDYENELKDRWASRRSSQAARGGGYDSMESWVGDRRLTGTYANAG